jgi:hypothetical protein
MSQGDNIKDYSLALDEEEKQIPFEQEQGIHTGTM